MFRESADDAYYLRMAAGLTQKEAADVCGMSRGNLNKVERQRRPTPGMIQLLDKESRTFCSRAWQSVLDANARHEPVEVFDYDSEEDCRREMGWSRARQHRFLALQIQYALALGAEWRVQRVPAGQHGRFFD